MANFEHVHLEIIGVDILFDFLKSWQDQPIYIITSMSEEILDEKLCSFSFLILYCLQCLNNLETNVSISINIKSKGTANFLSNVFISIIM